MEIAQDIFVIIPCFNEAAVIRQTVEAVHSEGYSVVVVDDASTDLTTQVLSGLPVYYIKHPINLGQGAAIQTGIDFAKEKGARFFVTFDADGQHEVKDIAQMIKVLIDKEVDIVFGSRFLPGAMTNITPSRNLLLNAGRYLNYFVSGILLSDAHNGIRVFNRRTAENIRIRENRMAHATEFQISVARNQLKYAECPVHIYYNAYSIKKGQRGLASIKILFEIILYKIFR